MITRRIFVNLVAFVVLAAALIAYGFFDLLGNPLAANTDISTVVPSASGLSPGFLVTLDGVDVGTVESVSLVPRGAKVTMALDPGSRVPADVAARIDIANALGEQEVELVPTATAAPSYSATGSRSSAGRANLTDTATALGSGPGATLRNGAVIPAAPNSVPADVGTVVAEATRLLDAIPAGSLNSLLHETAIALNGNVDNLKTIASSSELFSREFLAQQQQFEALLANSPAALDTVSQNAAALQQGLADTAVLEQVLATHSSDLVRLLGQGQDAARALETLVAQNEPNLACIVHDSSDLAANLGTGQNLHNLSEALSTNQLFFGAVGKLAVTGPAKALTASDRYRANQEWLRTHLLLPGLEVPLQPQPIEYNAPTRLPAVLPGAGCNTEFGQGVGPVTQSDFHPIGPGAEVVAPAAPEARVRGGGTEPVAAATSSVRLRSGVSPLLPMLIGAVVLGWFVTLGHRRGSRRARPLPLERHEVKGRSR